MSVVLDLPDEVAKQAGALLDELLAGRDAPILRAIGFRLRDVDGALLAAEVERWRQTKRKKGLAMTTDGHGAPRQALRELGLDLLGYSDQLAYLAWRKHYGDVRPRRRRP